MEVPGCKRAANLIFSVGTEIKKCDCCGVDHHIKSTHEFCYEHAMKFCETKHENVMDHGGYYEDNLKQQTLQGSVT